MNTTPNNPTPEAPEPGRAPDAHEDAATTPVTPADDQPTERMSETPLPHLLRQPPQPLIPR
ncbi:hypothetical protein BJF87_08845 [Gordonia sp. CNJ-863]|uniref:hypothetical protein n=1 Tax=Gordonia sp. CNJ-863 TaxID=1904963 RepID=UPI00096722BA|nr:hypothetical protein [Gordonia sp. CNJ-863]OLT42979.1 hypothetical protein BJF87_08845 [Gordonia sp. CNJ-863]